MMQIQNMKILFIFKLIIHDGYDFCTSRDNIGAIWDGKLNMDGKNWMKVEEKLWKVEDDRYGRYPGMMFMSTRLNAALCRVPWRSWRGALQRPTDAPHCTYPYHPELVQNTASDTHHFHYDLFTMSPCCFSVP